MKRHTWLWVLLTIICAAVPAQAAARGADDTVSAALDEALERTLEETGTPGVQAVVVERGRLVWTADDGLARLGTAEVAPRPVRPSTLFCFASFGKHILASFTLSLVEADVLALDAPIGRYVGSSVPGSDQVTLRMLLDHTAGYPDVYSSQEIAPLFGDDYDPNREWTPEMLIAALDPPVTPGETWEYSNTGYIVLAYLLDEITGGRLPQRVAQFLAGAGVAPAFGRNVITMVRSRIAARRFAHGYIGDGDDPSQFQDYFTGATLVPTDLYGLPWGDGAFSGTARGAARFLDALLVRGRLLEPSTVDAMLTPVQGSPGYGLGTEEISVAGATWHGHRGNYGGFSTMGFVDRAQGVTIFVTANKETLTEPLPAPVIWTALAEAWQEARSSLQEVPSEEVLHPLTADR